MRYFTGFLIAIGLIVLLFVLIFRGGGDNQSPKRQINLTSYASTEAVVRLTQDGPVNADSKHSVVKITIGREENTIQVMRGYQGDVIRSKTYANNQTAYEAFLHSLNLLGFTKGDDDPANKDERGYCPTGTRYIYELSEGGEDLVRYWSTNCNEGNYKGKANSTIQLFKQQIPDYDKMLFNIFL